MYQYVRYTPTFTEQVLHLHCATRTRGRFVRVVEWDSFQRRFIPPAAGVIYEIEFISPEYGPSREYRFMPYRDMAEQYEKDMRRIGRWVE